MINDEITYEEKTLKQLKMKTRKNLLGLRNNLHLQNIFVNNFQPRYIIVYYWKSPYITKYPDTGIMLNYLNN